MFNILFGLIKENIKLETLREINEAGWEININR